MSDQILSDTCPVVQVVDKNAPGGFVEINESDFDDKKHTVYKGKSGAEKPPKAIIEESTTPQRCQFIKGNDEQCGNDALEDSEFCHIKSHK